MNLHRCKIKSSKGIVEGTLYFAFGVWKYIGIKQWQETVAHFRIIRIFKLILLKKILEFWLTFRLNLLQGV